MGTSKTTVFTDRQNHTAVIMKALGHPARVAIIEQLAKKDYCLSDEIVKALPLTQPTIWQHLQTLNKAGLIQRSMDGNSLAFSLRLEEFSAVEHFYKSILQE